MVDSLSLSWDALNQQRSGKQRPNPRPPAWPLLSGPWFGTCLTSKGLKLHKGHSIPYLERPTTDGKNKASVSMDLTAAEMMHLAVNR